MSGTTQASAILGGIQSSWAGDANYPTLYGSAADRWVMHINPHVSYVVNGTNGYTGVGMTGATIRMAAQPAASQYWDVGIGTNAVGVDKFSIGRQATPLLNIDNAGNVGIGTTSPGQKLDVNGAITTQTYFNVDNTDSSRQKIKLYADQSDYAIGMQNGITFGGLNDWGMTFQFNSEDDRGFWWGDTVHTTAQGAMALTTNGLLTVASGIRVGYGESDTANPTANLLDVSGSISIDGLSLQDTATVTTTSTTQTALASYAVATYATGKFLIQATSAGNRHISELLVTHNGTVSTATEYAILKTSGNLFTVTTDISSGNVRILVTSASATSTVYKTSFTLIGV
jgi:hypothetical protein